MAPQEQLAWEARAGRPAAAAAFLSALLGLGGVAYGNVALRAEQPGDDVDGAFLVHRHHGDLIGTAALEAVSVLLLAVAVAYLYRATRFRRSELRPQALWMTVGGAVVYAGALIGQQLALISAEDSVVAKLQAHPLLPKAANDFAKHTLTHGKVATWALVQLALGVFLGAGVVLISLNARRAGLLSSFMGIVGIIVGVLLVLPFFGRPPIVEYFWVVALGLLFVDRWPGRWPRAGVGERRGDPMADGGRVAGGSAGRRRTRSPGAASPAALAGAAPAEGGVERAARRRIPSRRTRRRTSTSRAAPTQHPRSKKRKKKRRR